MMEPLSPVLVLPSEMAEIDKRAVGSGIDGYRLMSAAGHAIAAAVLRLQPGAKRVAILCGPGNNGGDGYVVARVLRECGVAIGVFSLVDQRSLKGDALTAREDLGGIVEPLEDYRPCSGDVIVDALFGAGLSRRVPAIVDTLAQVAAARRIPIIAVDLPSGIDGRTGRVLGAAFRASHTVTFVCRKPGHVLMPGRTFCGTIEVIDLGIPARVVASVASRSLQENGPHIWHGHTRPADFSGHKFTRGHLTVFSGGALSSGAARLSAAAGLKAGAGLVTIAAPEEALATNAAHLTSIMLHRIDEQEDLADWLSDNRHATFVLGPGFGDLVKARHYVGMLRDRKVVLDADGITAFRDSPESLFPIFTDGGTRLVMTPHEGEFSRLFPDLVSDDNLSKVERAREAARRSHAVIVYKGADTVVAAPDGRAVINTNAPPWLATAGSGDTLAGIIGAHLAQGMPAFEAAAAGVWRHGRAGQKLGEGLTADHLADALEPLPV